MGGILLFKINAVGVALRGGGGKGKPMVRGRMRG